MVALTTLFGTAFVGVSSASALPLAWSTTANPFAAFLPSAMGAPTPALQTDTAGLLNGVSCTDSHFCFAVGNSGSATGPTLTQAWDGRRWSAAPRSTVELSALKGVSCTARWFCVAVGVTNNTTSLTTLAEIWNGVSWSVPPTPNTALRDNELDGVSCVSPTSCTAVGHSSDGVTVTTLAEHWNGMTWTIVPSPNAASTSTSLAGVSCTSPTSCLAVGAAGAGAPGSGLSVAELWDGMTWTMLTTPNLGALESVSCVNLHWCFAAGATGIQTWNGHSWIFRPTPAPLPGRVTAPGAVTAPGGLKGASCASKRFCFVVGGSGIVDTQGPVAVVGRS